MRPSGEGQLWAIFRQLVAGTQCRNAVIRSAIAGGWIPQEGAAQQPGAHLLLHRGEVFWCQRAGLGVMDLPVLALRKHPVDHTAVEGENDLKNSGAPLLRGD